MASAPSLPRRPRRPRKQAQEPSRQDRLYAALDRPVIETIRNAEKSLLEALRASGGAA